MNKISPQELKTLLDANKGITLIDVRTLNEYNMGHIPQATPIPMNEILESPLKALDKIEDLAKNKSDTIYFVCLSDRRSFMAANVLLQSGLSNVCYIDGGTQAWMQAGFDIEGS